MKIVQLKVFEMTRQSAIWLLIKSTRWHFSLLLHRAVATGNEESELTEEL